MKRHFTIYASKNRPSAKVTIKASHLSDKAEEPAYGFRNLPNELQSDNSDLIDPYWEAEQAEKKMWDDEFDDVEGTTDITCQESVEDNMILQPGNQWYAVDVFYDYGDAESGPMVDGDWAIYQAKSSEEAKALCRANYAGYMIGDARLATEDEIAEWEYYISQGPTPEDYDDPTQYGSLDDPRTPWGGSCL